MTYIPLRVRAKNILKTLLPKSLFSIVQSLWGKTGAHFVKDQDVAEKYTPLFIHKHGYKVIGGPFSGMTYVEQAVGSSYLVKLIGVYEEILHTTVQELKHCDFKTIIDIGCAEGYYLVGLGMHNIHATLIGYDIEPTALELSKELYNKNNLNNELILLDRCTHTDLNKRITEKTLIICDAEGFEDEILDPQKAPSLLSVDTFMIELHEFAAPGVTERIRTRFNNSHTIETITFKNASGIGYPFLEEINEKERYSLLRERGIQDQQWLIMKKKSI